MIKRMILLGFFGLLYNPFMLFSQDSIPVVEDINEEKELKFQQFFFKALAQKSIKNYQKAIENLESCNEILPEDPTVYFEFSKNFFHLEKWQEAKDYIKKALDKEPDDIWMMSHLVEIHKRERDFDEAIKIQKKVAEINPKQREHLARLYYMNREYDKSVELMKQLEEEVGLSRNMKYLKQSLEARKGFFKEETDTSLKSLVDNFKNNISSFQLLKKLLEKAIIEDKSAFHEYSKKSVELFPAQPYAYLMYAKSQYFKKEYQNTINTLENGIDFVIDNANLESQFYDLMADAYEKLNNQEKAQELRNKAKKLRSIK